MTTDPTLPQTQPAALTVAPTPPPPGGPTAKELSHRIGKAQLTLDALLRSLEHLHTMGETLPSPFDRLPTAIVMLVDVAVARALAELRTGNAADEYEGRGE